VTSSSPGAALLREVSPHLADAELTFRDREPIDVDRARAQHAAYAATLRDLGLRIVRVPPAPEHPDGVFVEDTVVVVDGLAVLTRPGAATRRREVADVGRVLAGLGFELAAIPAPAHLDGGDVLRIGDEVVVGLSHRTDEAGAAALRELLRDRVSRVRTVAVTGALHLKTAATALPDGSIVAVPGCLAADAFPDREVLSAPEPSGANVLLVGDTVVTTASAPRTRALIAARGFTVVPVEVGELERAEAGVTCLSVLLPSPPA
jgi:dimethylargininase